MAQPPSLWLISGPNGVGKTTYAMQHIARISGSVEFINQDEIARGLYPLAPTSAKALVEAGKVSTSRKAAFIRHGISFSIETTLAGRANLKTLREARGRGYKIHLLYFYVDLEECLRRVARRVVMGGHDVPEPIIRRRYPRSLRNFGEHAARSDQWILFENRGPQPRIVAEYRDGIITVLEPDLLHAAPLELREGIEMLQAGS